MLRALGFQAVQDLSLIHICVLLEESSMEELAKKNSKYILLRVSDVPKASLILERQFHVKEYSCLLYTSRCV